MKQSVKPDILKILPVGAGLLGLLLRTVLYATGVDEKGLLIANHRASVALWILTGVTIAALFILTRPIQNPEEAEARPAVIAGAGAFAAAASMVFTVLQELPVSQMLHLIVGFAATVALAAVALCRFIGKKPHFLLHAVVCVFFGVRMVGQYQHWNSDPQIQNFVFYLGAYVALMLHTYQHTALGEGLGSHRALWCSGLIAVYLALVSLPGSEDVLLTLGVAVWVLTNLTDLNVRPRRQRPTLNLDGEPQEEV